MNYHDARNFQLFVEVFIYGTTYAYIQTYRGGGGGGGGGGVELHHMILWLRGHQMSVIQALKFQALPPVSQPSCSTWFCFKSQY